MKKEFLAKKGAYKVTFSLPKEALKDCDKVVLLGDFNEWDRKGIPMASENGHFKADLELMPGRYEFRYLLDDKAWENDWEADEYVSSPFSGIENSVIFLKHDGKTSSTKKEKKTKDVKEVKAKEVTPKNKKEKTKETAKVDKKEAPQKRGRKKKEVVRTENDLFRIEGIGPKIEEVLKEAGIDTFKKLAKKKPEELTKILTDVNPRYRIYTPTTWPQQADLAAKGKWDELEKLQKELNGGRKEKK